MKKIFLYILLLFSTVVNAQIITSNGIIWSNGSILYTDSIYNNILLQNSNILTNNGSILHAESSLSIGRVLELNASSINEDNLTYNSSGDLVTYFNLDTVVLDGSLEAVIGNSVRFSNPLSGTIYQIIDTLGSSDSLILNKTFTGLITDEFLWGGINTWYDESGFNNNALQLTAIKQPKLLWYYTDSVKVFFDGINDEFIALDVIDFIVNTSVTFYFNFNFLINNVRQNIYDTGSGGGAAGFATEITGTNKNEFRINDGLQTNLVTISTFNKNTQYKLFNILNKEADKEQTYLYGNLDVSLDRIANDINSIRQLRIGVSGFDIRYLYGNITEFRVYNRALTEPEIKSLSK